MNKTEKEEEKLCNKSVLEGGICPMSDSGTTLRMRRWPIFGRYNPLETAVVSKKEKEKE